MPAAEVIMLLSLIASVADAGIRKWVSDTKQQRYNTIDDLAKPISRLFAKLRAENSNKLDQLTAKLSDYIGKRQDSPHLREVVEKQKAKTRTQIKQVQQNDLRHELEELDFNQSYQRALDNAKGNPFQRSEDDQAVKNFKKEADKYARKYGQFEAQEKRV